MCVTCQQSFGTIIECSILSLVHLLVLQAAILVVAVKDLSRSRCVVDACDFTDVFGCKSFF